LANFLNTTRGIARLDDNDPTKAYLYPGIHTPEDALASLLEYRQWHEHEGELGRRWIERSDAITAGLHAVFDQHRRLMTAVTELLGLMRVDAPFVIIDCASILAEEETP
jgi:hypothetical protein